MGRPLRDHRPVVEGAIYRLKAGMPWRYLPAQYGAWQTVHRRHHKWFSDGTSAGCHRSCRPTPMPAASWAGGCRWLDHLRECISTTRPRRGARRGRRRTQGARPNAKRSQLWRDEPDDHAIGRSRGGLTAKTRALVDGAGRPLALIVSPGEAGDSPALLHLLAEFRVAGAV